MNPYPPDFVDDDDDDGTMPDTVAAVADTIVGRRIVAAELTTITRSDYKAANTGAWWSDWGKDKGLVLTLDDGRRVALTDGGDCCAYTEVENFLLHPTMVDHIITGVATEDGYQKWHILCDFGDVLTLDVGWSCGNPFYYSYGFEIGVSNFIDGAPEVAS